MMTGMTPLILTGLLRMLRTRQSLVLENLALRHQLAVLQRTAPHPRFRTCHRLLWVVLSHLWRGWAAAVSVVQPATVVRWQRSGFKLVWTRKSRRNGPGRPAVAPEVRALIRRMSQANALLYSMRPESELRRGDPSLPRKQRAEGGGKEATHDGQALADQRTEPSRAPGGSAPDCPGRQENGAEGSRESRPPEGRYKGNLPFLLRGHACEVRRRRTRALLPRSRLGGSDACGVGHGGARDQDHRAHGAAHGGGLERVGPGAGRVAGPGDRAVGGD